MNEETEVTYEAMNFEGLERRANYRVIAYREDMLHIFGRNDSAAIIYHIIYRWETEYRRAEILKEIERRKKTQISPLTAEDIENMMWIYMSYNDFVRESGHALGYNTVIRTLDYLVNDIKVFEQRENHDPHYPDYEYRINKEVVKALLCHLPPTPTFSPKIPKKKSRSTQTGTPDDASTQTGREEVGLPKRVEALPKRVHQSTQMGTEVYPNGGTSQNHTGNTQVPTEEREIPAVASTITDLDKFRNERALSSSNTQRLSETELAECEAETEHRIKAIKPIEQNPPVQKRAVSVPLSVAVASIPPNDAGRPDDAARAHAHSSHATGNGGLRITHAPTSTPPTQGTFSMKETGDLPRSEKELRKLEQRIDGMRAEQIWQVVEDEMHTTFEPSHRRRAANSRGMTLLLEDKVTNERLRLALRAMDNYQILHFNLELFHDWIPGLLAPKKAPKGSGPPPPPEVIIRPASSVRSFNGISKQATGGGR
jgi:hypothetical protein